MPNTPTRSFGRDVTNESPNPRDSRHVIKGYWGSSPSPSPIAAPRALSTGNFPDRAEESESLPIPQLQATQSPGDNFQFKTPRAGGKLSPSSSNVAASVSMDDVPLPPDAEIWARRETARASLSQINRALAKKMEKKQMARAIAMQKLRRLEDDRAELAKKLQDECGIVLTENSDASSLVQAINDLRTAELERKDAEIQAMGDETQGLLAQLEALKGESRKVEAAESDLSSCVTQLNSAELRLEVLRQELREAQAQGTPRGEGAKKVVGLSFQRIRDLQTELEQEKGRSTHAQQQLQEVSEAAAGMLKEAREGQLQLKEELQAQVALAEGLEAERAGLQAEHDSAEESIRGLEGRMEEQSARMEELQAERSGLAARIAALEQERDEAVVRREAAAVSELNGRISGMRGELEAARSMIGKMEESSAETLELLQSLEEENLEIRRLLQESDDACAKEAAEKNVYADRVSELCRQLADKEVEVMEAKSTGTPGGEGAKVVRDLALRRVKEREGQLDAALARISELEAEVDELQQEGADRAADSAARMEEAAVREVQRTLRRLLQRRQQQGAAAAALSDGRGGVTRQSLELEAAVQALESELHLLQDDLVTVDDGSDDCSFGALDEEDGSSAFIHRNTASRGDAVPYRLEVELQALEHEMEARDDAAKAAKEDAEDLRRRLSTAERRHEEQIMASEGLLAIAVSDADALRSELARAQSAAQDDASTVRALEAEVEKLQEETASSDAELMRLRRRLSTASEELKEAAKLREDNASLAEELCTACEPLIHDVGNTDALSRLRMIVTQGNEALQEARQREIQALDALRHSVSPMDLEREELQRDCEAAEEMKAEAAAALRSCRRTQKSLEHTLTGLMGLVRASPSPGRHAASPLSSPHPAAPVATDAEVIELRAKVNALEERLEAVTEELRISREAEGADAEEKEALQRELSASEAVREELQQELLSWRSDAEEAMAVAEAAAEEMEELVDGLLLREEHQDDDLVVIEEEGEELLPFEEEEADAAAAVDVEEELPGVEEEIHGVLVDIVDEAVAEAAAQEAEKLEVLRLPWDAPGLPVETASSGPVADVTEQEEEELEESSWAEIQRPLDNHSAARWGWPDEGEAETVVVRWAAMKMREIEAKLFDDAVVQTDVEEAPFVEETESVVVVEAAVQTDVEAVTFVEEAEAVVVVEAAVQTDVEEAVAVESQSAVVEEAAIQTDMEEAVLVEEAAVQTDVEEEVLVEEAEAVAVEEAAIQTDQIVAAVSVEGAAVQTEVEVTEDAAAVELEDEAVVEAVEAANREIEGMMEGLLAEAEEVKAAEEAVAEGLGREALRLAAERGALEAQRRAAAEAMAARDAVLAVHRALDRERRAVVEASDMARDKAESENKGLRLLCAARDDQLRRLAESLSVLLEAGGKSEAGSTGEARSLWKAAGGDTEAVVEALAAAAEKASEEAATYSRLGNRGAASAASSPPQAAARRLRVDLGLPATPGSANRTTTPARARLLPHHHCPSSRDAQTSPGVSSAAPAAAASAPVSGSSSTAAASSLPHSLHGACVQMPVLAGMAIALVLGGRATC